MRPSILILCLLAIPTLLWSGTCSAYIATESSDDAFVVVAALLVFASIPVVVAGGICAVARSIRLCFWLLVAGTAAAWVIVPATLNAALPSYSRYDERLAALVLVVPGLLPTTIATFLAGWLFFRGKSTTAETFDERSLSDDRLDPMPGTLTGEMADRKRSGTPIWNECYSAIFEHYADFDGRASRPEFWWFHFAYIIVSITLLILGEFHSVFEIAWWVFAALLFLPSLAVSIRRLHDSGKSGWWFLILFIPFFGWIVFLVFMLLPSDDGAQKEDRNSEADEMHCTSCGSQIDDDARFCTQCGTVVSRPTASGSAPIPPTTVPISAAYAQAFRNYVNFSGRTGRSEYWGFALPQLSIMAILAAPFIVPVLGIYSALNSGTGVFLILLLLNLLLFAFPLLSATSRRLHDSGKSALWLLLVLVPATAMVVVVGFFVAASTNIGGGSTLALELGYTLFVFPVKMLFWASVVCIIGLLRRRGDEGANEYGPPPGGPISQAR